MKALAKLKDDARKHEQREEWDKAISVYVEVLRTAEKGEVEQELPLFNRVGDLYVRLGKPADAVKYYEQAADHYAEAGLYNNAIALCNKALRYLPDRTELLKKLGHFSALQGFGTDARRWYLEYAEKMLQRGAIDEAFSALEDFANLSEDAEIRELLGRQLRTHGRKEQAVAELTRAHALRLEAGQNNEAERLKQEILALDPNAFSAGFKTAPPAEPHPHPPAAAAKELPGLMDLGLESAAGAAFGAHAGPEPGTIDLPEYDAPVEEIVNDEVSSDLPMLDISMAEPPPVAGLDIGMIELETPTPSGIDASDLGLETGDFTADEDLATLMSADLPLIEEESSFGMAPLPGLAEEAAQDTSYESELDDYDAALPGFDDELPMLEPELPTLGDDLPLLATEPSIEEEWPSFQTELPPLEATPESELPPRKEELSPLDADLPALDGELPGWGDYELPTLEGPGVLGADDLTEDEADPAGISDALFDLPFGELPTTPDQPPEEAVPPIALRGAVPQQPASEDRDFEDDYVLPSIWEDEGEDEPQTELPEFESPVAEAPFDVAPTSVEPLDPAVDEEAQPELPAIDFGELASDLSWDQPPPAASVDQPTEAGPIRFELPPPFEFETVDTPKAESSLPVYEEIADETAPEPEPLSFAAEPATAEPLAMEPGPAPADIGADTPGDFTADAPVAPAPEPGVAPGFPPAAEPSLDPADRAMGDSPADTHEPMGFAPVAGSFEEPATDAFQDVAPAPASDVFEEAASTPATDAFRDAAPPPAADPFRDAAPTPAADPFRDAAPTPAADPFRDAAPTPAADAFRQAAPAPAPEAPPEPVTPARVAGTDYVDLASFLAEEEEPAQPTTRFMVAEKAPTGDEERDFADMLAQFKQKIAENVSFDDAASHYDLGLAYKEMGLIDEAISEFQVAMKGGLERLKVFEELGQCFLLKQQYNIAATVLNRALQLPVKDDNDLIGVYYHLARSYEALDQRDHARSAYERVVGLDIGFRDAADRLARL